MIISVFTAFGCDKRWIFGDFIKEKSSPVQGIGNKVPKWTQIWHKVGRTLLSEI